MSSAVESLRHPVVRWLTFAQDGGTCAIDFSRVRALLRASEPAPVPGAWHDALAIVSLRGYVVSVQCCG